MIRQMNMPNMPMHEMPMQMPMQQPPMGMGQMGPTMCPMAMQVQQMQVVLNNIYMTVHMNHMALMRIQKQLGMEMEME